MLDRPPLSTLDGLRLHRVASPADPAAGPPRGTVRLVHGLGEHSGRYAALAQALNAAGWSVAAHDHRGHGRSDGPRGGLAAPDDLLHDLAGAIDASRAEEAGGTAGAQLLFGHSMGGAVAARFVAEGLRPAGERAPWWRPFDGLVLSSPALAARLTALQRGQLAVGRRLAPSLAAPNGLKPAWLSRDPAAVAAYQADPRVHDRITPRLAGFILEAGAHALACAPHWALPTLLVWGGADRCVAPEGCRAFAEAAPADVVHARCWPEGLHELFNEPDRDEVLAAVLGWLDARFPKPSVASPR